MYKDELITKPTLDFRKAEEQKKEDSAGQTGGIRVVSAKIDHPLSR
jgi:hypothetical protein